jgi:cobalt-zinc-cadmium efflux system membrane fusion protein
MKCFLLLDGAPLQRPPGPKARVKTHSEGHYRYKGAPPKINEKQWWGVLSLVMVAALVGCKATKPAEDAPAARIEGETITFPTNAPQLGYLAIEPVEERKSVAVGLYGRLAWDDDVTVRVFSPVAGRVAQLRAEINSSVRKGDVLATLASPDYGQAQADAQKAASDLALADRTLTRLRELFAHGAAAQKDVDSAEADYAKATSESARANAQLQALSLGHTNSAPGTYDLRSPLDGVVVERNISPGQQIRSDQMLANAPQFVNPLFVVTDPARLWLLLDATEGDMGSLSPDQEVLIRVRALPDKLFHGRVEVIGGGLDAATRTVKVRCAVDNSEKLLRAEMYVSADVAAAVNAGAEIPTKAVFSKDNLHYVFIQSAPGQFQRRAVKLGAESNGRSTIVEGLSAGQRVVSEGCLLLEAMLEGENS